MCEILHTQSLPTHKKTRTPCPDFSSHPGQSSHCHPGQGKGEEMLKASASGMGNL